MTKITDVIFVFVITFRDVSCRNEMTSMSDLKRPFFPLFATSVHVHSKRWNSIQSKSITAQRFASVPFYNYTNTIFMRAPADGKTISQSPLLPPPAAPSLSFSFVVLFFCGLILMKSLVVKSLGIRRAFNLYSVVNNGVNCSEWTSWRH